MAGLIIPSVTASGASATGAANTLVSGTDGTSIYPLKTDNAGGLVIAAGSSTIGNVGINAGTNNIGNVGGKTVAVTVTPTVTTANAYGANFVVGGLLNFANAFTARGSGIVQALTVTCKRIETMGFSLFLFAGNPSNTTWTDAAVANINAADIPLVRGPIQLGNSNALGTMTVANSYGLGLAMSPGTTSLYGVLLTNAALTNNFTSTSDISVTATILQDV